jgi:AsmA protein
MLKWLAIIVGALVLLVVAAALALPFVLDTPALQAYVSQAATQALGRPVKFVSLSISVLPLPSVRLRGLQVAEDPAFGAGPFLTVGEGRIGIRLWPLFSGRVEMADLTLEEPRIALVEDAAGHWNLATLGAAAAGGSARTGGGKSGSAAGAVLLGRVNIVNGAVQYYRHGAKGGDVRLERINLTVSQAALGEGLHASGTAVGQPGAVRLKISDASLSAAGAHSFTEAPLKVSIDVEAQDVAALAGALVSAPAVAGTMKGRLEVKGTPARPAANGLFTFERLTLSEERARCAAPQRRQLVLDDLRVPVSLTPAVVDSAPVQARVARGTVSARASVALGAGPLVTVKEINVKGLELGPVLVDYLCDPFAVSGPLDLTGEASLRTADPWRTLNGAGHLRIGPGKVVGAELLGLINSVVGLADEVTAALRSGRPPRLRDPSVNFDSITGTYTITNGVVRTEDLLYQAGRTQVAAAGTYGLADGRVAMDVTLTEGSNQIKGKISGAGGSLRVVPTGVKLQDTKKLKKLLDQILR